MQNGYKREKKTTLKRLRTSADRVRAAITNKFNTIMHCIRRNNNNIDDISRK